MEGIRLVLRDNARPTTRTAIAVTVATFVSGATFALSTASATDPGRSPAHPVDTKSTETTKPTVSQRAAVAPKPKPVKAEPNRATVTSTNTSTVKTSSALGKFSTLSRREMATALKSASRKGRVPSDTALAKFTVAIRTAESGGRYSIRPARGSSISGAYQAARMTWDNYRGYRYAYQAPRHVQDAWAFRRFITLWQLYRGDWERVAAHHFLPAYADENKALWRQPLPLRFRAGNPPTVREYVRRVYTHL